MPSKIKKMEDFLLSAKNQGMLQGGLDLPTYRKNCTDICTVGTDPLPPGPSKPQPGCGFCNCKACWGEESSWFAAGMNWATSLNG